MSCRDPNLDTVLPDILLLQSDQQTQLTKIEYGLVAVQNKTPYEFYIKNRVTYSSDLEFKISVTDDAGAVITDKIYSFSIESGKVAGGKLQKITAYFTPALEKPYNYIMLVTSNSVSESDRSIKIPLKGTGIYPKLVADATKLDYGEVYLGSTKLMDTVLHNIGSGPLTISDIVKADPGGVFLLFEPSPDSFPLKIPQGESVTFKATFGPAAEAAYDGTFVILSDDPSAREYPIAVTGVGVPPPIHRAPVAVIACPTEGIKVALPGELGLDGTGSYDPDGDLPLLYKWTMKTDKDGNEYAPAGSNWCFDCNRGKATRHKESTKSQPVFFGDLIGDYTIQLVVTDTTGMSSKPAECVVHGYAKALIHVEMLGSNPLSDLDIHLVNASDGVVFSNPFVPLGFFSCPCDCYPAGTTFKTNNPDWGIRIPYTSGCKNPGGNACDEACRPATPPADAGITCGDSDGGAMPPECFKGGANCVRTCTQDSTKPYLQDSIDDNPLYEFDWTDSKSPEITDVVKPSIGRYHLLVYFFQDNGGGDTDATIRLYIKGQTKPEWQFGPQTLNNKIPKKQLWDVAVIEWAGMDDAQIAVVPCTGICLTDVTSVPDPATCTIPALDGGYSPTDGG
jgi:hypothetical protein